VVEPGRVLGDVFRGRSHVIYISPITPKPRQLAKCSLREPWRDLISLHIQPGMTRGSLSIRDVEIQAAACAGGVDQGLQPPGRGALDHGPTSAAMRSRGKPGAYCPHLLQPREHLAVDPETQGGIPVIAGTRVPYDAVAGLMRDDVAADKIADYYPGVSAPAARDALDFARYVDSYDPATRAA
jgi:uncharacterized protein (DUF433 family)